MNKSTRQISIVAAFLVLFGAVFLFQYLSNQKEPPKKKAKTGPNVPTIETLIVKNGNIPSSIDIQGRLVAFDKIDIFSEVTGTLESTAKPFKVGTYFKKGDVLLEIDDIEARLNLLAQKSALLNAITQIMPDLKIDYPESFENWSNYLKNFDVEQPLQPFPEPVNDQEKFFIASKNLLNQYYSIKSAATRLDKYTIYTPFSGVITQASINPGSIVRAGQKLGELMNNKLYELEATVPMRKLELLKTGSRVQLFSDDISGTWNGRVKRINDQIDPTTQSVIVFIDVNGPNLKEGMYLKGEIAASVIKDAFEIPKEALINQKSVFVFKDSVIELTTVEILKYKENTIVIKGLNDGVEIVSNPLPGSYNGMKVNTTSASSAAKNGNGKQVGMQ